MKKRIVFNLMYCIMFCAGLQVKAVSQNAYGWERIFDSIYGIDEVYMSQMTPQFKKIWLVRTAAQWFGSNQHDMIRYHVNTNSWRVASNGMLKYLHYYVYVGGGYAYEVWAAPIAILVSPLDTNFVISNMFVEYSWGYPVDSRFKYSYNNGVNNSEVQMFNGYRFSGLAMNPENDSLLYASSNDIIYKSTDRSVSWNAISTIQSFNGKLTLNPHHPEIVYAFDDSLYVSLNSAVAFEYAYDRRFSKILFGGTENIVLASSRNSFFGSTNYGLNWNFLDSLRDSIKAFDIDPDDDRIVYAGTRGGLYRSTNRGEEFFLFNNSFTPSGDIIGVVKERGNNFVYVTTLEAVYKCWNSFLISAGNNSTVVPDTPVLFQNYPNPFNPSTTIEFQISNAGFATIKLYDILGREVMSILSEFVSAGRHETLLHVDELPGGTYFYRLVIDDFSDTKILVILK